MAAYHLRFVGAEELPRSLADFDVEHLFRLSTGDVDALRARFRADRRLGAAVQLVFLRATGRQLDRMANIPRALLRSLCTSLSLAETSIASLRSIYQRRSTLYEHQKWVSETAGFSTPGSLTMTGLGAALDELAGAAASVDELVKAAEQWLFARQQLLPGDRVLRDAARRAFASVEAAAIEAVKSEIPATVLNAAVEAMFSARRGRTGGTVLEWLKIPAGKHGPTNLSEILTKIAYLKSLGVDAWALVPISSARLRAYAQAVVNRPPTDSKRRREDTQILEIACFLRVTLLDLTDSAIYMAGRRVSDMVRHASSRVQSKQARGAATLRETQHRIREVLYAEDQSSDQKVEAIKALLPDVEAEMPNSHAALIRLSLTEDATRVTALLNSLSDLDLQGEAHQRPMKLLLALRELTLSGATALPSDFDVTLADPVWHDLLIQPDRAKALAALKASVMLSVRQGLRGGRLWIDHSWDYRNREDLLISPKDWKTQRQSLVSALSLSTDPKKYLERLHAHLKVGLHALSDAIAAGKLEIDAQGLVRLPALQAMPIDDNILRTRDAMFSIIGKSEFCDMIVELDASVGFSETLLGRRAHSGQELVACYAALLAHGTENDAKGVAAMVPNIEVAHVTAAMRALEAPGRLRRANERLVEFQRKHPIAELWGSGDKASADMMALDASRHLFNARVDPRRRNFAVGIYTHVLDAYGVIYDQPIVLNERQGAAAVEGVEHYKAQGEDGLRLSLLAVDTHGYTYVTMAVAKLLGFDLCPQLRDLAERRLYLPRGFGLPENLERIAVSNVTESAIVKGWDELLRLIASIRSGRVSARSALEKLGSAAQGDAMHKAADQLGRLLRTLFLCDFFSQQEFRREIHTLLNRGESVHQLQRAIYFGRVAPERGRRREEIRAISGSHALLTNIVIAWNTMKMQAVADRWRKEKHPIEDTWLRRMGPVHFGNVNFRGRMSFGVERYADALLHRNAGERRHTAA